VYFFQYLFGHPDEKREVFSGDAGSLSAPDIPTIREMSFPLYFGGRTALVEAATGP
jgi:hypothetical protein